MDIGDLLTDSISYTREAFVGQWVRWMIFIILGLPIALIGILYQKELMMSGGTAPDFENFPWIPIIGLFTIGLFLSVFTMGYTVRIYRGTNPAPDFDYWGDLFIDGIKSSIVGLIWMIPVFIIIFGVAAIAAVFVFASAGSGAGAAMLGILFLIAGMVFAVVVTLIIIFVSTMGVIRFARTGSMREGINVSAIREHIGKIGWGAFIIAMVVLIVVRIIFMVIIFMGVFLISSLIPVAGSLINPVVSPLLLVFTARYFTKVYEIAGNPAVPE